MRGANIQIRNSAEAVIPSIIFSQAGGLPWRFYVTQIRDFLLAHYSVLLACHICSVEYAFDTTFSKLNDASMTNYLRSTPTDTPHLLTQTHCARHSLQRE